MAGRVSSESARYETRGSGSLQGKELDIFPAQLPAVGAGPGTFVKAFQFSDRPVPERDRREIGRTSPSAESNGGHQPSPQAHRSWLPQRP